MKCRDVQGWYVMLHMGGMLLASTVFVFKHPEHFANWSVFVGTVGAIFHWLIIREKNASTISTT